MNGMVVDLWYIKAIKVLTYRFGEGMYLKDNFSSMFSFFSDFILM